MFRIESLKQNKGERVHRPNPYKLALGLLKHRDRQLSGARSCGTFAEAMIRLAAFLFIAVALASCDSLLRSDKPLSRPEALSRVGLPLPESAHNIYYIFFAGGMQDLERFVRFDVAPEDIPDSVEAIIDYALTVSGKDLPYTSRSISATDFASPRNEWMPVDWWNLIDIRQGYYRGEDVSYGVHIWVDTQRSRVYVYQND